MQAQQKIGATLTGTIQDPQGNVIPDASVSVTDATTKRATTVSTATDGSYILLVPHAGDYTLVVVKEGFQDFSQSVYLQAGQRLSVNAKLFVQGSQQSVVVHGGALDGATPQPSQQEIFNSNQTIRVIDRKQMDMVGPVAGGAQVIGTAPGALVTGYGNTGATKNTITINGLNQGWGGYGGYTGGGALMITFDGVPIVDPATQLWASATLPQGGLIQNTNVTYGPGSTVDRWYTNVGGSVEFTPLQPTEKPHANVVATYGSYQQKNLMANASSGLHHGWSVVLGGGAGKGDDFRIAPDGFKNPSKDWAVLAKAVKTFQGNSLELGSYYAYGGGYRPQVIPIAPNPYITTTGLSTDGLVYSQPTSGFYSSLPFSSYNKYDVNQTGIVYARLNMHLDATTTVQNLTWYQHIARSHDRYTDVYALGAQEEEHNNPHTNTFGDKFFLTKTLPWNTVTAGGYYLHALYNTRQNFYNTADGGSKTVVNIGGEIRSGYFSQDDFAIFLQDDIHPVSKVHITPGLRYVGFTTGYSNGANQDFTLLPGVILRQFCSITQTTANPTTYNVKDQGSTCDAIENRSGVEPSVSATVEALPSLNVYGGFQEALRAPSMGGGGGLFQAVEPQSYHLERATYYQFGAKIHTQGSGFKNNMILGAAYYHQQFANQEIDTTLANGTTTYDSNGTSNYNGVNIFFDDDPLQNLHLFANANIEAASYSSYITGGQGGTTCNPPSGPIPGCVDYSGLPVAYVPTGTLNAGAFYDLHPIDGLTIEPTASFQFIGSQHLFDNCNTPYYNNPANNFTCGPPIPSATAAMPAYATLNLGAKATYKRFDASVKVLNVLDKEYNIFEYISAGSYFGTASATPPVPPQYAATYIFGYPGAPVTAYVSVAAHF